MNSLANQEYLKHCIIQLLGQQRLKAFDLNVANKELKSHVFNWVHMRTVKLLAGLILGIGPLDHMGPL